MHLCIYPGGSEGKESAKLQETWVWFLGWEDPLEAEMATHFSILAWRIPWTEEPGGLQSIGWQRVQDWATNTFTFKKKLVITVMMTKLQLLLQQLLMTLASPCGLHSASFYIHCFLCNNSARYWPLSWFPGRSNDMSEIWVACPRHRCLHKALLPPFFQWELGSSAAPPPVGALRDD